ncbi:MAG: glycosyltransferase family 39 protein [Candidatus Promineifilaceae bacterium]
MESVKHHRLLLLILLFAVGVGLFLLAEQYPSAADSIGYAYAAERFVQGEGVSYEDSNNKEAGFYFSLFAFQVRLDDSGRFYLGFPPGLPLLLALAIFLLGNDLAVRFFIPFLALLGVYLTGLLGEKISERRLIGFLAAVILVGTAVFWQFGTAIWSDIPSMTLVTAGFYFFIRSRDPQNTNRSLLLFSVISAFLFVVSFFIRYANVILMVAVGFYELVHSGKKLWRKPAHWLFFIIVGLGCVGILVFNNSYYGGYTITSYSPIHGWYPQPAFSASYVWGPSFVNGYSLREALNTLWQNFSVFLVFVPLGGLKMKRPFSILTIISIFLTIAFYSFYAFAAAGINSRFLLPIFPLAAISIATGLIVVLEKIPNKFVQSILVIGSCVILFRPLPGQFSQIQLRNQTALHTVEKVEEMVSFSAPESVFLSYVYNDQLIYYGNRSVLNYRRIPPSDEERGRYLIKEYLEPCLVQTIDRLLEQNVPVYYVLDSNPSFWNSFDIIQNNYETQLQHNDPEIYAIVDANTRQNSLQPCDPE